MSKIKITKEQSVAIEDFYQVKANDECLVEWFTANKNSDSMSEPFKVLKSMSETDMARAVSEGYQIVDTCC